MFIFDTNWFEQIGITSNNNEPPNNDTNTGTTEDGTSLHDSPGTRKLSDTENKALVLAPPRKILKALEDKNVLEQSGQFIVGAHLDSVVEDILRDPFGFIRTDTIEEPDSSSKYTSSFRREGFTKSPTTNSDGTRKRHGHTFKSEEVDDEGNTIRKMNKHNTKASIIDGFNDLLQVIVVNIGEFERTLQANNLLPNYKNTILPQPSNLNDEKEDILKFHVHPATTIEEYLEDSSQNCDSNDMKDKLQRCIVSIKLRLLFYLEK